MSRDNNLGPKNFHRLTGLELPAKSLSLKRFATRYGEPVWVTSMAPKYVYLEADSVLRPKY